MIKKGSGLDNLSPPSRLTRAARKPSSYRGHITLLPPSIARVCPVMKEAPGLAKKATVSATWEDNKGGDIGIHWQRCLCYIVLKVKTSCTVPGRPMAWVVLLCSRNLSICNHQNQQHCREMIWAKPPTLSRNNMRKASNIVEIWAKAPCIIVLRHAGVPVARGDDHSRIHLSMVFHFLGIRIPSSITSLTKYPTAQVFWFTNADQ